MPYIKSKSRIDIASGFKVPATAGELNYVFTKAIINYLEFKGKSYQTFNDVIGALEGAKLEVYRRVIAPYEDKKAEENGDVY